MVCLFYKTNVDHALVGFEPRILKEPKKGIEIYTTDGSVFSGLYIIFVWILNLHELPIPVFW